MTIAAPGCRKLIIKPDLGDLSWARGTFPTPLGLVFISHEMGEDGCIVTRVEAPEEITVEVQ